MFNSFRVDVLANSAPAISLYFFAQINSNFRPRGSSTKLKSGNTSVVGSMFLDKGWVDVVNFSNSLAKVSAILDLIPPWREVIPSNLRDYGEMFPLAHPPPQAGARSVKQKSQVHPNLAFSHLYLGRDLNPHGHKDHRILSPACLPIPPPRHPVAAKLQLYHKKMSANRRTC